jgi:hypothetical protein
VVPIRSGQSNGSPRAQNRFIDAPNAAAIYQTKNVGISNAKKSSGAREIFQLICVGAILSRFSVHFDTYKNSTNSKQPVTVNHEYSWLKSVRVRRFLKKEIVLTAGLNEISTLEDTLRSALYCRSAHKEKDE